MTKKLRRPGVTGAAAAAAASETLRNPQATPKEKEAAGSALRQTPSKKASPTPKKAPTKKTQPAAKNSRNR